MGHLLRTGRLSARLKHIKTFGTFGAALCLCACGGGGGGAAPATTVMAPVTTTQPVNTVVPPVSGADAFRTAEYFRMGPLDQIRAADAYALGYTGKGVLIGIVDFNFDFNTGEMNFHPDSIGPDAQAIAFYTAQTREAPASDKHGYAVAATAAALRNNSGGEGVAFDATVLGVDYFSRVNEQVIPQLGTLYRVSDPWTYITSRGGRIINTSFGYEASDAISNPPHVNEAYVLASSAVAVANGALLVASAGNASGSSPSQSNFDIISDMQSMGIANSGPGAFIIVGAVDSNNQIAIFSDKAGLLKDRYMVAPGTNFILPWNNGTALLSGTSFSAPLVSGAAALVLQRWPFLTAHDVANILLNSATDLGAPGVDDVYGHGLLNLAAALQPNGITTFAVAGSVSPTVSASGIVLSPVFGDAPALHQALSKVMILDGYKRDFEIDLSHSIGSRPNLPDLFGVMEQRLGWHSTGFLVVEETAFSFDVRRKPEDGIAPFQALAGPQDQFTHDTVLRLSGSGDGIGWAVGRGLSLHDGMASDSAFAAASLTNPFAPVIGAAPSAFASVRVPLSGDTNLSFGAAHADNQGLTENLRTPFRNSSDTASLRLDHDAGKTHFILEMSDVLESGGLMGSLAAGGLKMGEQSSTMWTTGAAETALDAHWSLKGAFTMAATGTTHPVGSLISSIAPVYATSFAAGIAGHDLFRDSDALSFTFGQPLRAEHASATMLTGVDRDWSTGAVIMGEQHASLLPSGREFDFESGYRFLIAGWSTGANVAYIIDPDHVRNKIAVVTLLTLQRSW